MINNKLKLALTLTGVFALQACSTLDQGINLGKGYANQGWSALNNQTHDKATSITYDKATGQPTYVTPSEGQQACKASDELRGEVRHKIATKQEPAIMMIAHEQFKSATNTCAQYTAYNEAQKGTYGCELKGGDVVVKATGTEPATPSECSSENIFLRQTEIKKHAYLPGGKYNP